MKLPGGIVAILTILVFILHTLQVDAARRSKCQKVRIRKGRSRMMLRGTMIKFMCRKGYTLVGSERAICIRGQWNRQPPVCVAPGCPAVHELGKLRVTPSHNDSVLSFACDETHALKGERVIYCNGKRWSSKPPTCIPVGSEAVCDFESGVCGWTNSDQDHFDWTLSSGKTPTRYTGPSWDHTYGDGLQTGNYLFIETSSPRQPGDTALLLSPVFPASYAGKCFQFWYHMYGRIGVGSLSVFVKRRNQSLSDVAPLFSLTGNQGNEWRVGHVKIPHLTEKFQVIIKGEKQQSVYGDIAIDDVSVLPCPPPETTSTATTATSTSVYVTSSQENPTTSQMVIGQDTSHRQTTFTLPGLSTEHISHESTVERSTTGAETSTQVDTPDFTTHVDTPGVTTHADTPGVTTHVDTLGVTTHVGTLGFTTHADTLGVTTHIDTLGITTGPTTTRQLFTIIFDSAASKTKKPPTAGDVATRQTTEMERSSTVGLMMDQTSDQYKVTSTMYKESETTEVLADGTTRQTEDVVHSTMGRKWTTADFETITRDKEVMSTTEHPVSRTARHPTRGEQLVTDTTQYSAESTAATSLVTGGEQLMRVTPTSQEVTTIADPSTRRLKPTYTTERSVPTYTTATEASVPPHVTATEPSVPGNTSESLLANKRILDETTFSVVADDPSANIDSATNPTLRYKHRKVSHNIPLISSMLALAALISIAIGVVMWMVVNRREQIRQQDQELTPIATAYTY